MFNSFSLCICVEGLSQESFNSATVSPVFPINWAICECQSAGAFTQHGAFTAVLWVTESYHLPPATQDKTYSSSLTIVGRLPFTASSSSSFLAVSVRSVFIKWCRNQKILLIILVKAVTNFSPAHHLLSVHFLFVMLCPGLTLLLYIITARLKEHRQIHKTDVKWQNRHLFPDVSIVP